ncbi:DUF4328 domain-containing protein [Kineococcus sp. SYSU DK001]|uniref:DUF4328 domain-containing protein n=1 Tax=Kineococcus sp. SYSU DK001 TaxID=3383122 RepID=UPI003D7C7612
MTGQPFRDDRARPSVEVPFFAPAGGDFPREQPAAPAPFGTLPTARFGGPAPVPAPGPAPAVAGLRPLTGLGQAAVVLAGVVAATDVLAALASVAAGTSLVAAVVTLLAGLASFAVLVANWVVVALWLTRARANAERLAPAVRHRRNALWAWFGWIVPIAWLFVPHQVVADVWTASRHRAPRVPAPRTDLWWGLWLAGLLTSSLGLRLSGQGLEQASTAFTLVSALLWAAAVPVFAGVVRAIAAAQAPGRG